ncbi:hypothetical protein [Bacillus sp. 165]|uniref:hypothetical protein n=1 Tax=Bacillus sp. 165 TaxID=1529117 RepID=UPI001ADA50F5|nr:hypothetical protein [Bacillus sp. 165]MBO9129184.1 hypothetical protein [Bacillus sp. 165]
MKKKQLFLVPLLSLSLLLPSSTFAAGVTPFVVGGEDDLTFVEVNLENSSYTYKDLETISTGLYLTEFQTVIPNSDEVITIGYQKEIGETTYDAMTAFEQSTMDYIYDPESNLTEEQRGFLWNQLMSGDLKINHLTFYDELSDVQARITDSYASIAEYTTLPQGTLITEPQTRATPPSITKTKTTPYTGRYSMITNSTGAYITQIFKFSNTGISGYLEDSKENSFELDTVFYNYDGEAWVTKYGGTTQGTWWSTNLPSPYLDTQFGDDWAVYGGQKNAFGEPCEVNLGVGSADAEALKSEKEYYYNIKVNKNYRYDNWLVKLNSQPGKAYLGNQWGVFSYATYKMSPTTGWNSFSEDITYYWNR